MNIIVFIKQVPDNDKVKLDPKTGNLMRDNKNNTINAIDKNALEAALRMKDATGGTVTAVTMGPPQANEVLNRALAMGVDRTCLLTDRKFGGADTLATGYTLAKAAERIGDYDLLITGNNSSDGDTAQVGPIIAEILDIPSVYLVNEIVEFNDSTITCTHKTDTGIQKVRVKFPALITVGKEVNTPRYQTPANVLSAVKKQHDVWTADDLDCEADRIGIPGSPSVTKKVVPAHAAGSQVTFLSEDATAAAKEIVDVLKAEHVI